MFSLFCCLNALPRTDVHVFNLILARNTCFFNQNFSFLRLSKKFESSDRDRQHLTSLWCSVQSIGPVGVTSTVISRHMYIRLYIRASKGTRIAQFDVHGTVHHYCIFLSTTNKMQHCTIFFITVNAVHVSGGYFSHHQELKNCTHRIGYMSSLLTATASGSSKQG